MAIACGIAIRFYPLRAKIMNKNTIKSFPVVFVSYFVILLLVYAARSTYRMPFLMITRF